MSNDLMIDAPAYKSCHGMQLAYRRQQAAVSTADKQADEIPHVVFCGGFHSNMMGTKAVSLAQTCSELGVSYTRFDYRGHGESEGDPAAFSLSDWLDDTLCVLEDIQAPLILVGSSMGAWLASLCATRKNNQLHGLLLIAAAPDFLQELIQPRLTPADIWDLQQGQTLALPNAYADPHPLTQALLDSGKALSILNPSSQQADNQLGKLDCKIRLIHGTQDTDVPYSLSLRLMEKCVNADAQLTLLNGADHRLSDERSLACIRQNLKDLICSHRT
ncbi:MAG: alpha/beta hydrolase [Granulosicoccus sp.]